MRRGISLLGRLIPSLMARLAEQHWSRTRRGVEYRWEQETLTSATVGSLDFCASRVVTYAWGCGDPVLLAHGWGSRASRLCGFVEPLLQQGYRVISYDAPGHGRSSGRRTNLLQITGILGELVRQHGAPRAIIGHSFGGLCAVHAVGQGLPAGRVVCIASPPSLGWLMDLYTDHLGMPAAMDRAFRLRVEQHLGRERWKRLASVADVACPPLACMVVHDRDDPTVPWKEGRALVDAWPGAKFLMTTGLGHHRILRDPEVIREVVRFVSEL